MLTSPAPSGRLARARQTSAGPLLPWIAIGGGLALFAAFGAGFDLVTPYSQAPDEGSHLAYTQLVASHFQLPVGQPERQQPPLYYLLGAALLKAGAGYSALEALAIVFGVLAIFVAALCARELWPERPWRWALVAFLIAALPQVQFIAAHASNDSLSMLVGALLILFLLRALKRPPGWTELCLVGLTVAAALLVKETLYYMAAILVVAALVSVKGRRAGALLPLAGIPAVLAGWWFVRNLTTFGHLLPDLRPVYTAHPNHLTLNFTQLRIWFQFFFQSFFDRLGNMSTVVPIGSHPYAVYHVFELFTAFVLLAGASAVAMRAGRWTGRQRIAAGLLVLIPAIALFQAVINSFLVDDQPQGRYLFVTLPAMAACTVFALDYWAEQLKARVQAAFWLALAVAAVLLDVLSVATASSQLGGS